MLDRSSFDHTIPWVLINILMGYGIEKINIAFRNWTRFCGLYIFFPLEFAFIGRCFHLSISIEERVMQCTSFITDEESKYWYCGVFYDDFQVQNLDFFLVV